MVDTDERRRAQRFPLDLPMEVKWQEETEAIQKLASIRDISASGVYFTVDREVRPESKIEFYVQLQMEG
ncbi:MAG: PilZ domain-containing protein, partial [Candidatus Acidiferrales bacterium]